MDRLAVNQVPVITVPRREGGVEVENPEMDFLQYLLRRFIVNEDIDVEKCTVKDLLDRLMEEMTPIGGG